MPLTDDEYSVLLIAAEGESLAAIGRWEKPIDDLVEKGLLRRGDKFNNTITPEGRKAVEAEDRSRVGAFVEAVHKVAPVQGNFQAPEVLPPACTHQNLAIIADGMFVTCNDCAATWKREGE